MTMPTVYVQVTASDPQLEEALRYAMFDAVERTLRQWAADQPRKPEQIRVTAQVDEAGAVTGFTFEEIYA